MEYLWNIWRIDIINATPCFFVVALGMTSQGQHAVGFAGYWFKMHETCEN